ncbi:pentapeptide repeat-containing protein [Aliarcobacter butzleri]|uniref:pentapeptide repeat-containing protein n=1 Tax=Aliarcobacter butzleri TaxID=28197 RepID=UPI00125EC12D|nr:NACHT domain-containing protein [Aliarcobacter butzleri]
MNKKSIEKMVNIVPDSLKNVLGFIKVNFDENAQDTLSNSTGTIGILIKLFAQDKIDSYFNKITKNKLKNFGTDIYLKASLLQIGKSLETVKDDIVINEVDSKSINSLLMDTLEINNNLFTENNLLTIFTPQYHPIVVYVRESIVKILNKLNVQNNNIRKILRNFNEGIELSIIETFGDKDYEKHKKEINDYLLKKNESSLLWDMFHLNKIGFKEDEVLNYEQTFVEWKSVSKFLDKEIDISFKNYEDILFENHENVEDNLVPAEELINEYFDNNSTNTLANILFLIADFGKGKSVFLKQYASKLAKEYIDTKDGYFPIYFNLRNFHNYSSEGELGVINDFLLQEYQIKINDEYFKNKKYIFLVDSLDESGELIKSSIEKVINSIKSIQNLDKTKCISNRIIITSRPFCDGLENQLKAHKPYNIINESGKEIPQFISIYGFKKEQFNNWLYQSLKNYKDFDEIKATGFAEEIINSIKNNKPEINIYEKLLSEKTLSNTELKRPIFAYMIYQLIINNVDFSKIGKIGIYLSFINLLTKDAKYVNDKTHKVNLEQEISYRNILHSISALWMYERQQGQQGVLKKADICRVIDGKKTNENDKEIIERYKNDDVTEIQFLSHSYFGEEDNKLHFQHQSFAEILLAEYYLKVFIKYALERKIDIDEVRSRLTLGEPTEQTILFFKELICLLKDTVTNDVTDSIIEKRKLLYPLMCSLSIEKHNPLYSSTLYYEWFKFIGKDNDSPFYHPELLNKWAIDENKLNLIIDLASNILNCKDSFLMCKTKNKTALFDEEVTIFENKFVSDFPTDIDKWLSLVVGNLLFTDINNKMFFNEKIENCENLFQLIKNWNYSNNSSSPVWANEYFNGIKMNQNFTINLSSLDLSNIDFSFSSLNKLNLSNSNLDRVKFNNCTLNIVDCSSSSICETTFDSINLVGSGFDGGFNLGLTRLIQYVFIPNDIATNLLNLKPLKSKLGGSYLNFGKNKIFLSRAFRHGDYRNLIIILNTLKGLFLFCLKESFMTKEEIMELFEFEDDSIKDKFVEFVNEL